MNASFNLTALRSVENKQENSTKTRQVARKRFNRAYAQGKLNRFWSKLTGRETTLRALIHHSTIQQNRSSRIAYVPLDQIVGSEGRVKDFDRDFHPLTTHTRERWISIVIARRNGVVLPPVELVQDREGYYVRDGHHRISVAKAMGQLEIEAVVVN